MAETPVFIIGIILGGLIVLVLMRNFYLSDKVSKLTKKFDKLKTSYDKIYERVERKKLNLRKAVYVTKGWHYTQEKEQNPNGYRQWDVTLTLMETGERTSKETKFKVVDFSCGIEDNTDSLEYYQEWFERRKGGGWLDPADVEWIETTSKEERRGEILSDLLDDENE